MRKRNLTIGYWLAIALAAGWCGGMTALAADPAPAKAAPTRPATAPKPPGIPWEASPRDAGWISLHERQVAGTRSGKAQLAFLGDSITAGWASAGKDTWAAYYASYNAVNLGIGGDRTEHVLYRIKHGALDHIKPKVLVLMIGTNNTHANSAEDIAKGVAAIVAAIRQKLPETKVLLLAVFPRGPSEQDTSRLKVRQINERIAKLGDGKMVHYLDIGARFLDEKGNGRKEIMPDLLHLSPEGYAVEATAINPKLEELLGEKIIRREVPTATKAAAPATKPVK